MKYILHFFFFTSLLMGQVQIGSDIEGEASKDFSGSFSDLSWDGSIVAIGAPDNDGNGVGSGHVRIYKNQSGSWVQIGNDIDGEAPGDSSGRLSLSSDGSVIAISAALNDGNGDAAGHVRIFENQSNNWVQIGGDIDGEASGDLSGLSVSLSSNGSVVAIGAPYNSGNGNYSGHVRVYENQSSNWVQVGSDIDGEAVNDLSGDSVSLSSDGSVLAVGAPNNDGNGANLGQVRIYENQSGNWVQIGNDIDGEANYDNSGSSVSLSADGSVVAIGAVGNDEKGEDSGHVRIYENQSGNWVQIGSDIDGEAANDGSGRLSLSSDGSVLAVGAPNNDGNGEGSGHVRIFRNQSGNWSPIGIDINGEASLDFSGTSVSLSADGSVLSIGAGYNDRNGQDSGHVRIYDLTTVLSINHFQADNFSIYPNPVEDAIHIKLSAESELKQINLYNILAQNISSTKRNQLNVGGLQAGVYFLEIETNRGKSIKKVIIE